MYTGEVTTYDKKRGFGFICLDQANEREEEIFVHAKALQSEAKHQGLRVGERVEFEIAEGERGPQAVNVRPQGQ